MSDIDVKLEIIDKKISAIKDILAKTYHYYGEIIYKSYNHDLLFHQSEWYLDFIEFEDYVKSGKDELAKVIASLNEEIAGFERELYRLETEQELLIQSLDERTQPKHYLSFRKNNKKNKN